MMSRFANCLVILAIGLLGLVAPSEADPGQITESTFEFSIDVDPSVCPSWPYTETISGSFKMQVLQFQKDNANVLYKSMSRIMASSLCTGTVSGATWRAEGGTQFIRHDDKANIDGRYVYQSVVIFKLVGVPDPALPASYSANPPNYSAKAFVKFTINANGEVTVDWVRNPEITCA